MNKNLYRIIFNKRRGQLMVVAENASSQGKAAKGEGGLDSGVFEGDGGGGLSLSVNGRLRPLALAIFGALGMVAFVAGPAMGQIVADPNAPGRQRPTVVQSANGVTQVNIQTPSAAGVSRNTYSQFDVTANGAILNNSRGNVQTQTGGWVQGNPWLAGGSARVILNEVNSANPSQLRGYVEVAGQRAEVVIANPAGVAIDGGGFINASRVVLTTGTPILNDGSLDGYMVQRGVITINGRGLDTSLSDYTAILARAAQINGGIWAQELKVVTGTNQIDAAHGVAGAASGVGPAPAYALDVAQLGGMYAGKITLIGTEAGLGVRNAGVLAATAGNLVLQSNGWLSNSGNIQSAGSGSQTSIAVTGDVANSGTVYAGGDSQVQAQGNIANSGVIGAQNNVGVQATGAGSRIDATAGSVLAAGLNLDNTLTVSGKLNVSAGDTIAVHGTAVAGGDSSLAARQLDLAGAQVSGANVSLGASAGDLDASRAQVSARERLQLDAARTVRSDAAQLTGQQLGLNAHDLSNVGGQITQLGTGDLSLQLPGSLDNTRGVIATNSQALRLQAASLSNQDGQIQHAGTGALEIGAGQINLQRGSIISNGAMALTGEQIDHRDARTVAGQLSINAGTLDNRGGSLAQSGQGATGVQVRGVLDNRGGALESNGTMTVQAAGVQNQKGRIVASGDLALSTGALDNTEATLAAGGKLRLDSGDIDNTRGQIQALAGDAALTVAKLNNTAGSVFAGGNLVTKAGEVLNSGNLYAAGSQTLQVNGAVSNSGVIAAQGDNSIDASRIDSVAGSLLGAGVRADGSLAGGGQLQLTATQAIAAHGQNLAAGKTSMHAAAIDLSGSQTGGAAITLNATAGNVVTDNALVTTTGLLSVTAAGSGQALSNVRGTLSAGQLDLNTGSLDNRSGTLIQTGNGDTTLQGSTLDNTGGRIAVNSAKLGLHADTVLNRDGSIEHAGTGSLSIEAARFDDERGKVTGNGLVDIQAETIDHRHAITSGQNVTVQAGQLDNSDGTLQQTGPGQMRVDVAQTLDNTRGNIASNGGLQVQAGVLDNSKGRITSAASADIASKGALNNTDGVMAATKDLQVGGVHIDNTRGVLQANMLRIDAATLLNQQGTVSAGTDLTARISADLSNAGLMYAGRNQQLTVGGLLNNTGSITSVNNATITAGKVTSSGLLGAGVKADGSLGTAGDLTINADGVLQASGQNLAAGTATLTGANVDLSGSQTGASNIAITARSGDVLTNKTVISASNVLAITANANNGQSLVNTQGQLVAGQLQLNVANLNNASGEIVQTGVGDTVITTGKLDNTAGRIAVNSNNLALNATVLTNINGKLEHAGSGLLAINAGQFNNQFGKITGNGKVDITAITLDHRNATTVANQLTINAGSLDNRAGSLAQTGTGLMTVSITGQLDNTGGKIEGNGDALIKATTLLNNTGRIVAAQDAVLNVGNLDNTEGTVAAGRHLNLSGGDVDNTKGQLQAVAGNATLNVADLNNAAGSVFTGANLNTTLDTLNNTGSLYAAGNQTLNASATITNTGVIAAQGNNNLTAKSIDSSASSLIGAGIQADGKLGTSGDLTISTAQSLAVHGQILAAGNANLSGATLDITGSQTGAANIGLTATQGDVNASKAAVTTLGTLNITSNATLHNTEGTLQAGQLDLHVANLDNAKGVVLQTGTGDTTIVTGNLNNTAGRIAVNSKNLNIDAVTITNQDGKIEHAGTGILNLQAGLLDNRKGRITSAAAADIVSKGVLNNTDGVMAATADLHVGGVNVDNTRGVLQADTLHLDASSLLNQQGSVSAGTDLTAKVSGDLNNAGLLYAGRNQQLTVGGLLNNTGSIASVNNTTISAGKVTSSGLLGAGVKEDGSLGTAGDLTINADGVLQASGQNLAAGTATLTGTNVDLSGNQTGAANIAITANTGDVVTNKAVISASNVLAITANATNAQSLVNGQGQLVAGQLQLNVANLNNASGEIVQTGTGDTVITTGKLDNTAGRIAVNSNNLALNATVLTNVNGKLEHAGASILAINAGQFNNQSGKITGNGKVDITATTLDHRNATTVANQLTINASSLDNRSGSLAQTGTGLMTVSATGQLDNMGGKIEGNGDALVKAATLLNNTGRIVAAQDAVLNVGSLDNTEGTVAAGRHLQLSGGDIDNTKGQLQAVAGNATLNVANLNNTAGNVFAGANLNATLASLDNTGSLYAAGNQSLTATGTITNTGVIAAQGNNITAKSIDSSASSLIGAGIQADGKLGTAGDLTVHTAQTLAAHGQTLAAGGANLTGASVDISGSQTGAATIGLTATQGDVSTNKAVVSTPGALTIHAQDTLRNTEGQLSAGHLELHVGNLDNTKGTVIQTGTGDTVIQTGKLDNSAGRIAVNSNNLTLDVATLTNAGGKIEHAGSGTLAITAATLQGASGSIIGNGAVDLKAGLFDHANATTTGRSLSVQANSLSNRDGHLLQTGAGGMTVAVTGLLDNTNGEIAGNGVLSLQTGSLDNSKGKITSATSADIVSTGALVNTDGVIAAATDLHLGGAIDNTRGLLQAGTGVLSLDAASLRNAQGTVSAGTDITTKVSGDVLNAGVLYAGRNQTLDIGGLLSNTGSLAALGNTAITAGSLSGNGLLAAGMRADGSFASAGDLAVTARGVLQAGGQNMAAGQLQLTGASVDAGGSQTSAANIGLTALTGNVTTSKAVVSTNGLLSITANAANGQALVNQSGSLSAGQLSLRVANLDNIKGTLIQTGAGDTVIETGKLDNTDGRIAVNSANLRLQAGDLTNIDGKIEHAGKGVLEIHATNLYGQRGQLTGNGALGVAANYIDHRNASLLAQQVSVSAGILDNRQGQITQLGTNAATVLASARLDNSGGKIEANGNVRVETGELLNDHGRIASAQDVNVAATGKLDNTSGVIIAGRDLTVAGGKVDNTLGQLQAAGGNAQLSMDELLNAQGRIVASGNLTTTAGSVRNSGSLFAGGEQVLKVSGALENTGVILAQGNNTINANSVNSGASSLIGAGVKADGSLQTSGNLQVTTQQALGAHGQVLAAGNAVLSGGSVDLGGSRSSAGNINLTATTGDVSTSGAVVTTPGALTITAGANTQAWNNQRGDISAGQLAVGVGNLNNQQGSIVQTGTGNTVIELTSPAGVLDNTGGRIAVNSANLSLKAGILTNTDGKIEHAGSGTLNLQATQLNDLRGQITGNGALVVTAGTIDHRNASTIAQQVSVTGSTLDNAGGNLTQLGKGDTSIQLTTSLDNRGGTIASNGNTNIVAPSLNNQGGKLQAAGTANLTVTASNVLDNRHGGAIAGGGNVVLSAGNLLNQGGSATAGGQLTANVAQALNNAGGLLAATGNMTVNAASVDNSAGGKLASVQGQLQVTSTGATVNNGGTMQAGGDIILSNGGLWNAQGTIAGANVTLDTHGQLFNNNQGTLAGTGTVNLQTGILDNDGGLLQSGGAMTIDTHGNALLNTNAGAYAVRHPGSAGGISSGAGLTLQTGSWNNAGGYLGAAGNITGSVGPLDNRGGQIVGKSALDLTLSGLHNQGGQIQVLGNIGLNAGGGSVNNQQGLIRSGAAVTLTGGAIDNASTLGANQGIEGVHVTLNSANVSNVQGAVRADGNLAINSAGSINNTLGMLSAGGALALQDIGPGRGLAVTNTGGTIIGGQRTDIRAGSLSGDGKVLSQKDMALDLAGNFTLNAGAEVMANGNADITIGGQLVNAGKIQALSMLTLGAANFDNTSTGDINAGTTRVNVGGLLNNRGVIDGINTELNVGTLNNMGTGRIYGDHLSIAGGTVNNDVEGGIAATIAARSRLDIGVTALNNREHGLIFSGGDMAIGGYLDGNRIATGWAGSVTNASATIEALGNLDMAAGQFRNLNAHFRVETLDNGTEDIIEYEYNGQRYRAGTPGVSEETRGSSSANYGMALNYPGGSTTNYKRYVIRRTSRSDVIVESDPGKILAGGNLTISSNDALNQQSHVIAGGKLTMTGAVLRNPDVMLTTFIRESGTVTTMMYGAGGGAGGSSSGGGQRTEAYNPADYISTAPAHETVQRSNYTSPSGKAADGVDTGAGGATAASASIAFATVDSTAVGVAGVGAANGKSAGKAAGSTIPNGAGDTGNAGQTGPVGGASGALVGKVSGVNSSATASSMQLGAAVTDTVGQGVGAVADHEGLHGSTRIGDAGKTESYGKVTGVQTGAASGVSGADTVDASVLASTWHGGAHAVDGAAGVSASERTGNAGRAGGLSNVHGSHVDTARGGGGSANLDPGLLVSTKQSGPSTVLGATTADGSERIGKSGQYLTLASVAQARAVDAAGTSGSMEVNIAVADGTTIQSSTGNAVRVSAANGVSRGQINSIEQVALANSSGRAQLVRTVSPSMQLPNASLFKTNGGQTARYLVETDPRFTNYRDWTGSDYMSAQVQMDPSVTQKRLGDGFYEQRLVREQVAELTGQRFVGDYTSDEQQYRALMDAGVLFARAHDLKPGVMLTPAQMAVLTSDIVWLVEQDVTLADGSIEKALVPQVFVRLREGDLDGSGSLLAGKDVEISMSGDLVNGGSIAGRNVVKLNAENVDNLNGRIHSDAVAIAVLNDLNNVGGTISANSEMVLSAGRDINVTSSAYSSSRNVAESSSSRTAADRIAGLYVTGDGTTGSGLLLASAGRDVNLLAGVIGNAGEAGNTLLNASRDINFATLATASAESRTYDAKNYNKENNTGEIGSEIQGLGNVILSAGNDVNARAATMQAGDLLAVSAGHDIHIVAGNASNKVESASQQTESGFLSKKVTTRHDIVDTNTAIGSSFGGNTVVFFAGNDIKVIGSDILSDAATSLVAKNNISIEAGTNTVYELHHSEVKESGLLSGGSGLGISYGKRMTTMDQQRDGTMESGQARSLIGSVNGNLTISASNALNIKGSDVGAGGDLGLSGKSVTIAAGQDTEKGKIVTKTVQDGFSLALGGTVVSAIQTVQGMGEAMGKTSNGRVQAMAAATAALAANNAKSANAQQGPSVSISLTYGHSESEQTQMTASTTHSGSILSGKNINITATGGGKDSNINILGSELNASNIIRLSADNQVNLLAVQDTESQHTTSSSLSASAGVSANISKSGAAFGLTGSVSASQGKQDGEGSTQLNTHINAGKLLVIHSGGDTTIKGAVANAGQVIANIGGNLNLESLQDTAKFDSKNQSVSVSGTYGAGASVNASFSQSKMHSDYANVQEQSGIQAGAGGFQITVGGNTDLKGAIISSSAAPGANSLNTGTLTQSDIKNHSVAQASTMGLSGGFSFADPDAKKDKEPATKDGTDKVADNKDVGKGKGPGGTDLINAGRRPNATDNLYEGSKLVAKNLLNNSSDSASSNGLTRSTVSNGVLTIRDNAQQQALTGKDGAAAIAALNRDTGVAHTAAEKQNVQELAKNAEIVQGFKNAMYGEATYYTDQTFIAANTPSKFYKLSCPGDRNACIKEPGLLVKEEITKEEAIAMKGVLAVNGIRNGMDRAAELAYQNVLLDAENKKPEVIVLMHIEQTQAGFADVLLAGYEKLLAPVLGYSAGDKELAQVLMGRQDTENLLLAHSRGAIVARNGLDIAASNGFVNPNLTLQAFGPGISNTDLYSSFGKVNTQTSSDKELYRYTYMKNDPIPVLTTMNPGNVIASMFEFINVYNTSYSAHSCYGTGAAGCATVSNPIAGDTFATKQDPGNIITFINGKLVKKEEKKTQ
ncbi:adhesin HecA family 20-residue repeat-containing protein [Janthinobacterium lividum]|uniref:Adhesin HecA family 20-residue repeat-containing protein n=1 Tax=Janthinobacterium lividum TaxID=29581 RepID=A0AB38C7A1_9BURK|nr:hemagglutinin repeat-containing protein [Janthinobacterium lividum]SFX45807.1 adhesin HecA family 20-residue repeat-containing protein [Janthinobacterium lividum]